MKKLMLLPLVGAAGALTFGAAAALNVNQDGASLQVGEDSSLACADGARIAGFGYNDIDGNVEYAWVDITDLDGNCDGNTLYVTPLDSSGAVLNTTTAGYGTGHVELGTDATDTQAGVSRYKVFFGYTTHGLINGTALDHVRLGIDAGSHVGPTVGS